MVNLSFKLEHMLRDQMQIMSARWERAQQAQAIKSCASIDKVTRDFPVLVSARGDLEGECFWKLRSLQANDKLWQVLRPDSLNNRVRGIGFKMINRAISKVIGCVAVDR